MAASGAQEVSAVWKQHEHKFCPIINRECVGEKCVLWIKSSCLVMMVLYNLLHNQQQGR